MGSPNLHGDHKNDRRHRKQSQANRERMTLLLETNIVTLRTRKSRWVTQDNKTPKPQKTSLY